MEWDGDRYNQLGLKYSTGTLRRLKEPYALGGGGGIGSFPYIDLGAECSVLCMSEIILFSEIPEIPLGSQHKINNKQNCRRARKCHLYIIILLLINLFPNPKSKPFVRSQRVLMDL